MWPRGYPLELISRSANNYCKKYTLFNRLESRYPVPLIQQGLVNGDPDVDAIYRLTRKQNDELLNVRFDEYAPPLVLKPFQYAPVNSQNTLYHYDAFWTLAFPLNVTFRECDILRGYVSMRMLQEIDGRVSFMPPNAFQVRNAHSYHSNYKEEKRLYEEIQEFVKALHEWKCAKATLSECYIDCYENLIKKKFLRKVELGFLRLWIDALNSIGFKWPVLFKRNAESNSDNKQKMNVHVDFHFKAVEQPHSSNANKNQESLLNFKNWLAKIKYTSDMCKFELKQDQVFASYEKVMLVIDVRSNRELDFTNMFISIHFKYISLCIDQFSLQLDLSIYLTNLSSYSIIVYNSSFETCASVFFDSGFRHQDYLVIRSIPEFNFWSKSIQLLNEENNAVKKGNYFIRTNVAVGVRRLNISAVEDLKYYCSLYKVNKQHTALDSLIQAIANLTWHNNDLPAENCQNLQSKNVWILDSHVGPRLDQTCLLSHLGQKPVVVGQKIHGLSSKPEDARVGKVMDRLSNYFKQHSVQHNMVLGREAMEENFEFYKNDLEFRNVDLVVCSYLANMCEGFISLNKTILLNPSQRYSIGRCKKDNWILWNENIFRGINRSKILIGGMSIYELEYTAHYTGLRNQYQLFGYSGFYIKNVFYNPIEEDILVGKLYHTVVDI
jgi:hypothetical protein